MRSFLPCLLLCLLGFSIQAQNSYAECIQLGDRALDRNEFKKAIDLYFAAEAFDPSKKKAVQAKVSRAFEKIEALRVEAEQTKIQAVEALEQVKVEQEKTTAALSKANKLINAFYFYAGRFALAFKNGLYYYVDKNGDRVEKLGYWEKAGHFGDDGFVAVSPFISDTTVKLYPDTYEEVMTIVRQSSNDWYLMDTTGKTYLLTTDDEERWGSIAAMNLRSMQLDSLPEYIFAQPLLELLWLNTNELKQLPARVGQLKNLTRLDLSENKLTALPAEIGQLDKLEFLSLKSNYLKTLPAAIDNLRDLKTLDLSGNPLTILPKEIGALKQLEMLDLSWTKLNTLPVEIGQLKNLKILDLEEVAISAEEQASLEQMLPDCQILGVRHARQMASHFDKAGNHTLAYYYAKKATQEYGTNFLNWHTLSWTALFVNQPLEAIHAAQKSLELSPNFKSAETNLALGYVLNNQWPEAEKIYQKRKGRHFSNQGELWDSVFLKDISDLEAAGITHPDFEKVKKLFEK